MGSGFWHGCVGGVVCHGGLIHGCGGEVCENLVASCRDSERWFRK